MSKSEKIFSQHHGLSMACSFRDNNEEYVDVCSVQSAAAINKDVSIKFVEWVVIRIHYTSTSTFLKVTTHKHNSVKAFYLF